MDVCKTAKVFNPESLEKEHGRFRNEFSQQASYPTGPLKCNGTVLRAMEGFVADKTRKTSQTLKARGLRKDLQYGSENTAFRRLVR